LRLIRDAVSPPTSTSWGGVETRSVRRRGSRVAGGRDDGRGETESSRLEAKEPERGRGERKGGKGGKGREWFFRRRHSFELEAGECRQSMIRRCLSSRHNGKSESEDRCSSSVLSSFPFLAPLCSDIDARCIRKTSRVTSYRLRARHSCPLWNFHPHLLHSSASSSLSSSSSESCASTSPGGAQSEASSLAPVLR
jgi:hypothetical protein